MKNLFVFLLSALCLSALAQNGGQSSVNEKVALQLLGTKAPDSVLFVVVNKQPCNADIQVRIGNKDFYHHVPQGTSKTIAVHKSVTMVRAKALSWCMPGGTGWVELDIIFQPLPIRVKSFTANTFGPTALLLFDVAMDPGEYFELQRSSDGMSWNNVAVFTDAQTRSFTDRSGITGKVYYRLRLVEPSATRYSAVVAVYFLSNETNQALTGSAVHVYSLSGTLVRIADTSIGGAAIEAILNGLPASTYILKSGSVSRKVVKIN